MTNDTKVFYARRYDPTVMDYVSTNDPRMGTREAIHRDGMVVDPMSQSFCPHEWLDGRGYVDPGLVAKHAGHSKDSLQALDAKCACGHQVFALKRKDEEDSVVCLGCGNGMFKTSFDADTGGWLVSWIDQPTVLSLRKVAGRR